MNDPDALANALTLRQDKERKIRKKIQNVAPQLASKIRTLRETHAVRHEALLHTISLLDEELAQSEATLTQESSSLKAELRKKLRRLEEKDERDRKAMSVATLPNEVLVEIFEHCVEGDTGEPGGEGLGFSPRTLALVSRKWYRVALATATLWRTILVTDIASYYWEVSRHSTLPGKTLSQLERCDVRMHSALQVCTTAAELKSSLGRARGRNLNITIGFSALHHDSDFYSQLYMMLFNDDVAPRITHLALEGFAGGMKASLLEYITTGVHLLFNLVCLITASFCPWTLTSDGKTMLRLVLENAKNLKYICLMDSHVEECLKANIWPETNYGSTIRNLRQLRVETGGALTRMFSNVVIPIPEVIIEDAAKVERVEERMMWHVYTRPWPQMYTPEMNFAQVSRIHLIMDDISLLSRLTFPVLEHLRLTQSSTNYKTSTASDIEPLFLPSFVMDLPKLRTLRITARHFSPVNRFNLPRLESFHMTSTHSVKSKIEADFSQLFSLPALAPGPLPEGSEVTSTGTPMTCPFQGINTLYVNANVSERLLIQALRGLPLLEVLRLVPGKKISQVLVRELTIEKSKHSSKVKEILCPALEIISLDLVSFGDWDREFKFGLTVGTTTLGGFFDALHKCVASRRKAGKPLRRCTVISREGQREYVES